MALPVVLYKNYVSIYGAQSVNSITIPQQFQFGMVTGINQSVDNFSVNDSVLFPLDKSIQVQHSGYTYFLVKQEDILLTEDPIEPEP